MPTSAALTIEAPMRVKAALLQATGPLTISALEKQTKTRRPELQALLSDGVANRSIYRWPDYRGSQRFWRTDPNEFARQGIVSVASEIALTSTALLSSAKKRLPGFPEKLLRALIQELMRDRKLRKYPALGREPFLIAATNQAYAEAAEQVIEAVREKVRKTAGNSSDASEEIFQVMARLEPSGQAPVSVRDLRAALPHLNKQAFDDAALKLRDSEKVFFNRHDFPRSLPAAELENLIDGRDGNFYIAISARYQ